MKPTIVPQFGLITVDLLGPYFLGGGIRVIPLDCHENNPTGKIRKK